MWGNELPGGGLRSRTAFSAFNKWKLLVIVQIMTWVHSSIVNQSL